jgi:hypothetical protein
MTLAGSAWAGEDFSTVDGVPVEILQADEMDSVRGRTCNSCLNVSTPRGNQGRTPNYEYIAEGNLPYQAENANRSGVAYMQD